MIFLLSGQFIFLAGGMLSLTLIANNLSIQNIAILAVVIIPNFFITSLVMGPINQTLIKYAYSKNIILRNITRSIHINLIFYSIITSLLIIGIVNLIFTDTISIIFFYIFSSILWSLSIAKTNTSIDRKPFLLLNVCNIGFRLIFLYYAFYFMNQKTALIVGISVYSSAFVSCFILLFYYRFNQVKLQLKLRALKTVGKFLYVKSFDYFSQLFQWGLTYAVFNATERYALNYGNTQNDLALYHLTTQYATPVQQASSILNKYLIPIAYGKVGNGGDYKTYLHLLDRYFIPLILSFLAIFAIIIMIANPLDHYILFEKFSLLDFLTIQLFVLLSIIIFSICQILQQVLMVEDDISYMKTFKVRIYLILCVASPVIIFKAGLVSYLILKSVVMLLELFYTKRMLENV